MITSSPHPCDFQTSSSQLDSDRFLSLSLDMVCVIHENGYFQYLSSHWEDVLGYSKVELLSQPWVALMHLNDREVALNHLQTLCLQNSSLDIPHTADCLELEGLKFENRYRCQDGSYKWLLWHASFCPEKQAVYAVVRDITEHKRSRQALRESEERFRCLVENVKDYAIYMLDPDGTVISWNSGAERINGYTAAEIIGQPVAQLYPPKAVREGKPAAELQIAATLGRFEDESRRVRRDGSQFWAHAIVTALHDKQGQLRGFAKVTRDITERKRAEATLQKAYDGLERRVQERTAELLEANRLLRHEIVERKQAEAGLRQSETQLLHQTQQLQQALHQLKQTQAQLVQSEKMSSLGQLVAGVAHEINNPVSFIYGNVNFVSQYAQDLLNLLALYQQSYPQPTPAIKEALTEIDLHFILADLPKLLHSMKAGADRIRQLVLSLRNFSRLEEAEKKPVDIHEGIDNTLMILQNRLKAQPGSATITVNKTYTNLPLVDCHAGQLNQVFMSILSNAIDALQERINFNQQLPHSQEATPVATAASDPLVCYQPTIHIQTEQLNPDWIVIRIADNGIGMTEQVKQRLFDPFFTTKPVGKGTGLGLSISYQIVVKQHGGQLKCQSVPGQGTEFAIEIPIQSSGVRHLLAEKAQGTLTWNSSIRRGSYS